MKIKILTPLLALLAFACNAQQISYFNQGFLRQQNAAQDLAWLGIGGTNRGLGTVTNFSSTGFPPLFSASVTTPTTWPHVAFAGISQSSNLVFASPDGVSGVPTFRRLTANDLPGSGGSGTVTSFSSGDLSPIFTTTVATATTTPALSYNLTSQSANTVFAGPTSGGSSAPTFRALVAGDIPSLSGTYLPLAGGTMAGTINFASSGVNFGSSPMFQASANQVTIRNGTTAQSFSVYSTFTDASNYRLGALFWSGSDFHVGTQSAGTGTGSGNVALEAAGTHRLIFRANSTDLWTILDPTAGGTILPLTDNTYDIGENSTPRRPRTIYIGTSLVTPGFQLTTSPTAGYVLTSDASGVGTWQPSSGGGGGSSTNSLDLYMTNLTAYANSSNYFIDFGFPSAILTSATNVIAFNYSTNWGLANTSRVCNILVPATNFGRIVTFANAATNWHIQPQVYFIPLGYNARLFATQWGQGETNVTVSANIDSVLTTSNTTASFNPTNVFPNSGGLGTKLWLDASKGAFQDEKFTMPSIEGAIVRGWVDQSGFVTGVTNMSTTALNLSYHTPMLGPENVPCMSIYPGQSGAFCWLESPSFTALTAPIWGFVMYYGRSGGNCVDATAGTRFAINPAEIGQVSSFFCSSGISYTSSPNLQWVLVACLGNGASSVMRTNGVQAVNANAGTPSPSKWIVFGDNTHTTMVGSFNVAEILVLATNLSNAQLTNVESYFYRKYPFWNPPTVQ